MHQPIAQLTQSNYYSPCLNAAIFDGSIRIYFAQSQEPDALEVYFQLQKQVLEKFEVAKRFVQQSDSHIFVLLYPSDEVYEQCCKEVANSSAGVIVQKIANDYVLGVRGPVRELEFVRIQEGFFRIFNTELVPESTLDSQI